jgi:hypothetical protein
MSGERTGNDVPEGPTEEQVRSNRQASRGVGPDEPWYGLALSGGGIRSATFCLGVLRGLAKRGLLKRFDYLSTVSGGGYVGSALGRLYKGPASPASAAAVENAVANDDSLFLWWLRQNGRFLTPAGARDLFKTWTTQCRAFIATQLELALLALLLGVIVVSAHMVTVWLPPIDPIWFVAGSAWFLMLPVVLALVAAMMCGYWFLGKGLWAGAGASILTLLLSAALFHTAAMAPNWSLHPAAKLLGAVCLVCPLGYLIALVASLVQREAGRNRVLFNNALAGLLGLFLGILFIGCLDVASWAIRHWLMGIRPGDHRTGVFAGAGIMSVLLAALRTAVPAFLPRGPGNGRTAIPWLTLAQIASYLLLALIILFWTTFVQLIVFPGDVRDFPAWLQSDIVRAACLVAPIAAYILITGQRLDFLNLSSLHLFYRSRLARAYTSTGNFGETGARFPASVLGSKNVTVNGAPVTDQVAKATELLPNDDMPFPAYAPHLHGGPIHLINCCINQTIDDRTGTFNADRKGVSLTVSSFGAEIGTGPACPPAAPLKSTTLAEWIAISGAAIGSGMGTYTRSALSALLFISGLRLGYWQKNLCHPASGWAFLEKYRAMLRELLGMFPGLKSPRWYLSDGGHFDNTGVYALLKRRLDLIVLADCGADPDYLFGDVENLVRKARIDYDCDIEFIDPLAFIDPVAPVLKGFALAPFLATPTSMTNKPGDDYLLLARVTYPARAPGEEAFVGALLIVKPRVPTAFDLDTTAYAERQPPFPQQPTSQQFFSEEQWESYCHLGTHLGSLLSGPSLAALPGIVKVAAVINMPTGKLAPKKPVKAKRSTAATVGASIGLGAIATALIAIWQAWDSERTDAAKLAKAAAEDGAKVTAQIRVVREDFKKTTVDVDQASDDVTDLIRLSSATSLQGDNREDMAGLEARMRARCGAGIDVFTCTNLADNLKRALVPSPGTWETNLADYRTWDNPVPIEDSGEPGSGVASQPSDQATDIGPAIDTGATAAPPPNVAAAPPPPPPPADVVIVPGAPVRLPTTVSAVAAKAPTVEVTYTADDVRSACGGTDHTTTVYTQIYEEGSRQRAIAYDTALKGLGLRAPGIENVTATAARRGTRAPFRWNQLTLLYTASDGAACATALAGWATNAYHVTPQVVPLPQGQGRPDVLELWLP